MDGQSLRSLFTGIYLETQEILACALLTDEDPQPKAIDNQKSSPFFTLLPPEIRNRIYELAFQSTYRYSKPYDRNQMFYRPDFEYARRTNISLLQTCQLAYAEASLIPPAINKHTFWYHGAPPGIRNSNSPVSYFRDMRWEQCAVVQHLHFFGQQYWLDSDSFSRVCHTIYRIGVAPKKISLTLRHSEWAKWDWSYIDSFGIDTFQEGHISPHNMPMEQQQQPTVDDRCWGFHFHQIPSLEVVEIEFEARMRKKAQIDDIAQRALTWKFRHHDQEEGYYLVVDRSKTKVSTWIGIKEGLLKRRTRRRRTLPAWVVHPVGHTGASNDDKSKDGATIETAGSQKREVDPEIEEEYYIVSMTWEKQRECAG
ncbi:hypothetical protein AJ80_03042 [Polytolypa hystricis UAMH7299]|uniref:Uncharacterized protein n=1 Tax=Polytolypa hystricis (strain UAMH7299) TaxID=1447883 RepID=A0A2B7YKL8_POLH7|nr:hypothetical protein AJ80_03042 [Polytolypa hystricis UAMH7299]